METSEIIILSIIGCLFICFFCWYKWERYMDKYTELIENPKFNNLPLKEECFELIPPVKLSVGMIFTNDGSKIYSPYDEYTFHNFLWRVVKIEKLVDHPNHIVVSAILVGATVSTNIYQNIKVNKRGG